MAANIVRTKDLCKRYSTGRQAVDALRRFSVTIERGEFISILGPSGSGKSTLLHILGCLHAPTTGQYWLDGENVGGMDHDALAETRNAMIGFVFQAFHLQQSLDALRNVELPLVYSRTPRDERRDRAVDALRTVGLSDRMDHRPSELSGGEMQRVAIARALVNRPKLLLTDEPTGALDSTTGRNIMAVLTRLNEAGVTVIVVTHDAAVADWTHRRLQLFDGELVADEVTR